ncbi:response regulator transcription factor [Paucidesulfovibrio longus]|uniref:response regulator transcription factor n=1 Tax=Paucidesulfovibrio longus TaxID=889 RepID=UPI0003B7085E|nr:response regulator transcription factor [Paucidesulfovibrio longus]
MDRILIIDDDTELCGLLENYLKSEGFSLDMAHTAAAGLRKLRREEYALAVLDVMLPDQNGFDVLTKIRTESSLPVIMLTGRSEEIDRVVGLEMGADDYVPKPFPLRELVARIRAVLRRSVRTSETAGGKSRPAERLSLGTLELVPGAQSAVLDGCPLRLTAAEFCILELLLQSAGMVVEREALMSRALGRGPDFDDYVLNVHMSNLRKKLGEAVSIKTIRGRGYLLALPEEVR